MEKWNSRRSSVISQKGICSSSQPLASAAGVQILQNGGNAADAAVAMAAALNVCEPCSTGIGGDAFALYFDATTKKVSCLMGNGAASMNLNLDYLRDRGIGFGPGLNPLPPRSGLCITVPGAAACWESLAVHHGSLPLTAVLSPAIDMAENGVPIQPITAEQWARGIFQGEEANNLFKPDGFAPKAGEIFRNPKLAQTFRSLATHGAAEGFYRGPIADAIIEAAREFDGVLDASDLAMHSTQFVEPISAIYRGYRVYETPPPTHGIAALQALLLCEAKLPTGSNTNTSRGSEITTHIEIECMRLAYADALNHVCDPKFATSGGNSMSLLLNQEYIRQRVSQVGEAASTISSGDPTPFANSDTVYFCCVDKFGNACSMINSNYMGFGTGISPRNCGFTLHNRGHNASLEPNHPNVLFPGKRPYHTIIPGLITSESNGGLFGVFGNMGGFMQPMGHFQIVRNLIDYKMSPQDAVDAPRWYIDGVGETQSDRDLSASHIKLEYGYGGEHDGGDVGDRGERIALALAAKGHQVSMVMGSQRSLYGRAQIIIRDPVYGTYWGGSDPRADGCALPVI